MARGRVGVFPGEPKRVKDLRTILRDQPGAGGYCAFEIDFFYVTTFPETLDSTPRIHRAASFKIDIEGESESDHTLTYGVRYHRFPKSARVDDITGFFLT